MALNGFRIKRRRTYSGEISVHDLGDTFLDARAWTREQAVAMAAGDVERYKADGFVGWVEHEVDGMPQLWILRNHYSQITVRVDYEPLLTR